MQFDPGDQDPNLPPIKEEETKSSQLPMFHTPDLVATSFFLIPKRIVKKGFMHALSNKPLKSKIPNSMAMLNGSNSAAPSMMINYRKSLHAMRSSTTLSSRMLMRPNCRSSGVLLLMKVFSSHLTKVIRVPLYHRCYHPVTCAIYARENYLLELDGLKALQERTRNSSGWSIKPSSGLTSWHPLQVWIQSPMDLLPCC